MDGELSVVRQETAENRAPEKFVDDAVPCSNHIGNTGNAINVARMRTSELARTGGGNDSHSAALCIQRVSVRPSVRLCVGHAEQSLTT